MLNGRNPINLALLKPGVRGGAGGSLQQLPARQPERRRLQHQRQPHATRTSITIDGAIATRTRSAGAIIGTVNVDTVQEIQVLTANYLPEYGRSSGGQIRFVTKGGGRSFRGDVFEFFRDEGMDANSWTRNAQPAAGAERASPRPTPSTSSATTSAGPSTSRASSTPNRDKLFFFWAQEWIDYDRTDISTGTVPTEAMRRGDFSELLSPIEPASIGRTVAINDPLTGQPFPGQHHPVRTGSARTASGLLNTYPLPDPRLPARRQQLDRHQPQPAPHAEGHPPPRLRAQLPEHASRSAARSSSRRSIDAFRGTFARRARDWDRPNETASLSWTSTFSSTWINEATAAWSRDRVFIEVCRGTDIFERSKYGINYPYIFPESKEIEDKIPTITVGGFSDDGRRALSRLLRGTDLDLLRQPHLRSSGRHTFKAGVFVEYSGEDDFDQINVSRASPATPTTRTGASSSRTRAPAAPASRSPTPRMGLFTNYGEIGSSHAPSGARWRSTRSCRTPGR